ncbi:PREDICTED: uncharacterized protein LOC105362086 [Ceratosolen solmsi marchali]|uniref:Uncharacterized protein LOC105362086 n=1 Tax=Ceratosolen solmsi marchali TaxID=326594 RepID=A0AAJ6YGQ5_9HYME|nr:PREDICTED: uncharacterized protein LOC105362086 [Ceratosolen solmsi marchali]
MKTVMAGTEGMSGPVTDESLSSRLQWLRQRREALNDKLTQKNNELKNLCIEEAELTGVLPPEIPLEPGENPPNFRKRVGTSFNYSQNLINKLKTNGAEESTLELERQVQINIADAALVVLNDPSENKAVRRKHRSIYQQSQRRLQELNAQLNFIRQSHGGGARHTQSVHIPLHSSQPHLQATTKHRTKKPRPPLDTSGKDLSPKMESCGFLQEGGISLSPLGPEHNYNSYSSYDFQDLSGHSYLQPGSNNSANQNRMTYHAPSPVDHRRPNVKFLEHDLNANNNMYVAPDLFRSRAYSQGGNSAGSNSPHHFPERAYRPIPSTYSDEERQIHYRQLKVKKQENDEIMCGQQYPEPKYLDNELHRRSAQISYDTDINAARYDNQIHDFPAHYNHGKLQQPPMILRSRDNVDNATIGSDHKVSKPAVDTYVPPGYWMRLDDEIVWCTDEQATDRFGSLDRRKQNAIHHPPNSETQSRYHTVALGGKNAAIAHLRQHPLQSQVQGSESKKSPSSRILLRTQSLGSVESWQPQASGGSHDGSSSAEGRESVDGSSRGCMSSAKLKEKEWYETSLDSNAAATVPPAITQQQQRALRRASHHNSFVGPLTKERAPVRSNSIPSNRRAREQQQQQQQQQLQQSQQLEEQQQRVQRPALLQNRYVDNRVLEIPAESKSSLGSQENGNESIIPLNSTTIVQPGKYQPYREVTKPFEMSDFYKYSTKFRKRVEANSINEQQMQKSTNLNTQNDQNQANNPMQRIHQPVQRNACPPYTLR